ncbi:MAG: hypothetical protein KJP23_06850, partial [Deltaproteobacteria bacterium]|nr:hypothetical protein [Deltaproteobacteria bacterium]
AWTNDAVSNQPQFGLAIWKKLGIEKAKKPVKENTESDRISEVFPKLVVIVFQEYVFYVAEIVRKRQSQQIQLHLPQTRRCGGDLIVWRQIFHGPITMIMLDASTASETQTVPITAFLTENRASHLFALYMNIKNWAIPVT